MSVLTRFLKQNYIYVLLVFVLLATFTYSVLSEVIPINNGTGVDGEFYYGVAKGFLQDIGGTSYDSFRIQRIFPFFLINIFFHIFSIETVHQNLMVAMYGLHYLNLAVLIVFFFKMAKFLQWKRNTTIILFSIFFFNYFFLKNCGYEPFQTDGFAISIFLVSYYYLLRNKIGLAIGISMLGLLNWPTVTYTLVILALFNQKFSGHNKKININPGKAFALLYPVMSVGATVLLYLVHKQEILQGVLMIPPEIPLMSVSLLSQAFLLYLILGAINYRFDSPSEFFKNIPWKRLIIVAVPLIAISLFLRLLANDQFYYSGSAFILQLILRPLKYPFITPISHFCYFGLLPLLCLFFFKDFAKNFLEKNPGHALVFFIFTFFALDSEARHIIPYLPLLIVILGSVLEKTDFSLIETLALVGVQFLLSHFFYPINSPKFEELFNEGNFASTEVQRYMMNYGPWINGEFYLIWAIICVISIILLFFGIKKHLKRLF